MVGIREANPVRVEIDKPMVVLNRPLSHTASNLPLHRDRAPSELLIRAVHNWERVRSFILIRVFVQYLFFKGFRKIGDTEARPGTKLILSLEKGPQVGFLPLSTGPNI
jgi:hypothetical protein